MQLVFVYNANAGKWNALLDTLHKVISPNTYPCSLCAITYGKIAIEPAWEQFIKTLPIAPIFLHKDEFQIQYPDNQTPLPAVFNIVDNKLQLVLSNQELNNMQLTELIAKLRSKLSNRP